MAFTGTRLADGPRVFERERGAMDQHGRLGRRDPAGPGEIAWICRWRPHELMLTGDVTVGEIHYNPVFSGTTNSSRSCLTQVRSSERKGDGWVIGSARLEITQRRGDAETF